MDSDENPEAAPAFVAFWTWLNPKDMTDMAHFPSRIKAEEGMFRYRCEAEAAGRESQLAWAKQCCLVKVYFADVPLP